MPTPEVELTGGLFKQLLSPSNIALLISVLGNIGLAKYILKKDKDHETAMSGAWGANTKLSDHIRKLRNAIIGLLSEENRRAIEALEEDETDKTLPRRG